jgi:hypothetical protein
MPVWRPFGGLGRVTEKRDSDVGTQHGQMIFSSLKNQLHPKFFQTVCTRMGVKSCIRMQHMEKKVRQHESNGTTGREN